MDIAEFNHELNHSKEMVRLANGGKVEAEQQRLRGFLPGMADELRAVAVRMIDMLPEVTAPPAPPSPLMLEAMKVSETAFAVDGTREEMKAALAEGRRKIWAIADRADDDEEAGRIRYLTRTLDHLDERLDDPFWEFPGEHPT